MENIDTYDKWILGGYQYFSEVGPENFSIKELSKILGLSRTSFHYYFENKDDFFDCLIEHHMEEVVKFGKLATANKKDLLISLTDALNSMRTGIMFHVQLYINRKISVFDEAYLKGHQLNYENGILDWFIEFFNLNLSKDETKRAYLIFVDVLNGRLSYYLQKSNKDFSPHTVFLELIEDFKLLLK